MGTLSSSFYNALQERKPLGDYDLEALMQMQSPLSALGNVPSEASDDPVVFSSSFSSSADPPSYSMYDAPRHSQAGSDSVYSSTIPTASTSSYFSLPHVRAMIPSTEHIPGGPFEDPVAGFDEIANMCQHIVNYQQNCRLDTSSPNSDRDIHRLSVVSHLEESLAPRASSQFDWGSDDD